MRATSLSPGGRPWRELYLAAVFETDAAKFPHRIAEAEKAIALRARELFQTAGNHIDEEDAMEAALYALHVLRSTSPPGQQPPGGPFIRPR